MRPGKLGVLLTAFSLVLLGALLEWLSLAVYSNSLVNVPEQVKYELGIFTFTRIVYYRGGLVLESPPQLDYLQFFSVIAIIYLIFSLKGRRKTS